IGNVLAVIAIPWFVLQTTHSPAKTGVTGFFITLAAVVAFFFGGTIVDRLGFKRTSITADIASGTAFALIPLLYMFGGLQYWQLLALVFAGNFLDAPGTTARESLIPDLAEKAGVSLERASSLIQAVERGARMVGAPLAGGLIALIGAQNVIWVDAASFAVSALIVWMAVPAFKPQPEPGGAPRNYLSDLREGLAFSVRERLLLTIILIVVITNFLDAAVSGVMYPVYFQRFFGSAVDLGLVVSAGGAGALITALIFGAVGKRWNRRAVFFGGFALATLKLFIFPLVPPSWVLVGAALISGLGAGPINPVISTISYERIPASLRGRVLGTLTAVGYIATPLGSVMGGLALEWVDVRVLFGVVAVVYLATVLGAMAARPTRQMNARAAPAEAEISAE
ncbi:MAG TPA: MFS transporter, partial [Anaerolineaceae bacterium]